MKNLKLFVVVVLSVIISSTFIIQAETGKELYDKFCMRCHDVDGSGKTKMGEKLGTKDYTNVKVQSDLTDVVAIKSVKEGVKDKDGKVIMKATEGVTDTDIKAMIAHMRTFKK
jgi:cytochrome c5